MKTTKLRVATATSICIGAGVLMAGCTAPAQQASAPNPATQPSYATAYGVVETIQLVPATSNTGSVGLGAVVGGVVGGLLGNQVGSGTGKDVATVAGVVGGAVVGNQIEQRKKVQTPDVYQISVRLNNGSYQTIQQASLGDLQVGSRVRIENGRVERY